MKVVNFKQKKDTKFMEKMEIQFRALSQRIGLSKSAIRNYINGNNPPSLQNLGVIANIYNVSIADIVVYRREK